MSYNFYTNPFKKNPSFGNPASYPQCYKKYDNDGDVDDHDGVKLLRNQGFVNYSAYHFVDLTVDKNTYSGI